MIKKITILCLMVSFNLFGQTVLKKIQDKFESIESFSSKFKQEMQVSGGKSNAVLSGKFIYLKKNKYKIEMGDRKIVSDGNSIWNYNSSQKKVVITRIGDDPLRFSIYDFIMDYPKYCVIQEETENYITLIPDEEKLELDQIKIWFNKDYMVEKVMIKDFSGTVFSFLLSDVILNSKFTADEFTFSSPKGTQVIDLR